MSVFRRLRKCGERRKETAAKYNDSLALATLEWATIIKDIVVRSPIQVVFKLIRCERGTGRIEAMSLID